MSISEERKSRTKVKNRLNKELSLVQLLYLVNQYNLENEADINGGIYEHRLASLLSENIDLKDIDNVMDEVNSIDDDLVDMEIELRLLSKYELKYLLRDVDYVSSSFDILVKEVFLFVSLDKIRDEIDNIGFMPIESKKESKKQEDKSDNATEVVLDESKEFQDKSTGDNASEYDSYMEDAILEQDSASTVSVEDSEDIGLTGSVEGSDFDETIDNVLNSDDESEEVPYVSTIKNKVSVFEFNEENIESKLSEYDLNFLCDILLNNNISVESVGLNNEDLQKIKHYSYKLDDSSKEEHEKNLSKEKEKIIQIITKNISIDELNRQYFNPIAYEYFPYGDSFEEARSYQIETISQIYNAIEEGYKYIFLEACSGFGKSLIATTISRIYSKGKSYILTPTNQLLTPYVEYFEKYGLKKVKARKFSKCKRTNNSRTCSYAYCREFDCKYFKNLNLDKELSQKMTCNYQYQLYEGLNSDAIACTYDYFFTEAFRQKNFLKKRKLIICDEGHNIDNLASSGSSLMLYSRTLDGLGLDSEVEYKDLLETEDYYFFLLKAQHAYIEELEILPYNSSNRKLLEKDLFKLNNFLDYFEDGDNNISFEFIEEDSGNHRFVFRPIKTKKFISDVLFDYSDVCIFMSSSIFDYESFANDLGINQSEIFKLEIEPIFDLSKNPIKVYNKFNMEYDNLKEIKFDTLPIIDEILDNHRFEKGIIHAFSNECKEFLYENLSDQRRLITHQTEDRETQLERFKEGRPNLVFVSSSMDEGVDLPGELCRFQILFKLPYPSTEDDRVEVREATFEDGEDWYKYKMLTRLIQAYGRGIRYEGDYCQTYLLDNRIWDVVEEDDNGDRIIPQYFLDVLEEYDRFEEPTIPDNNDEEEEDPLEAYLKDYI